MSSLFKNLLTTLGSKPAAKPSKMDRAKHAVKKQVIKKSTQPKKAKVNKQQVAQADAAAREIINFAREEAEKIRTNARIELDSLKTSLQELQSKLGNQQRDIDLEKSRVLQSKQSLEESKTQIENQKEEITTIKKSQLEKLEKISGLSKENAKDILLQSLDKHLTQEIAERVQAAEDKIRETADDKAREILVDSMYHGATDYVAEYTISTVKLKDDDVKGRIIGKEGRNIRAFEKITGVDLDLDANPGEVRLSCYDPVRREIARITLEQLVKDGRIQPTRIEEYVAKVKRDIDKIVMEEGKKLCHAVSAYNVPPALMALLGRFKYRSSYGQNMIHHTLEETKIGMKIAEEIGANVDTVRLGCLYHDLGKVIDEEGSHVELGVKLLKKHNVSQAVIDTVAQHHEDEEYTSQESIIVYIADAISGSRPGARYENYDEYVKRLKNLEEIAMSKKGVSEVYAIQAGREVRVIVDPKVMSDKEMTKLARDIALEIKENVTYPGTVTVNVIRETRAQGIAK